MDHDNLIVTAIDTAPLNRGLSGRDWLDTKGNVPVIIGGGDVALFDAEGDKIYQVHFLFVSRGRAAIAAAKESFRIMFERYGAELIFGMVPTFRRDVALIARWAGGKFVGKRETPEGDCDLYVLSKDMWKAAA